MDVLFPKIGEIIGGSERESDYDKLMTWRLGILKEHGLGLKEIQETIAKIDPIPGANPRECGNYQDMNLNMANYLAEKFLKEVLYNIGEDRLNYPEG